MIGPLKLYRISRRLFLWRIPKLPGLIQRINVTLNGCDIPAMAQIGEDVRLMHHGLGVIIHHRTIVEDGVQIHPHVVIGQNVRHGQAVPLERITIGKNAQLGAGAKIIASGELTIGAGAMIGANAVVLRSVPANSTAVGIPARIIHAKLSGTD